MTAPDLGGASLLEIMAHVERRLAAGEPEITFAVLDPDRGRGLHAGELVQHGDARYVHRPWRTWIDLAERLGLRLLTPRAYATASQLVVLRFERLMPANAAPDRGEDLTERYGLGSSYARISKLEDPGFVIDLGEALARCALGPAPRILDLGVNIGDELALIGHHTPGLVTSATFVGIDHSASAIAAARARFPAPNYQFIEADLNALPDLGLGTFDLVISLSTLQSPSIDDRELLRRVVQQHLAPDGAVILGLPNCRYLDGEVAYGARMKNFRQPELGLLVKDIAFYRKYLQQHRRQVFVTGKHYLLVTAVPTSAHTEQG
jgi:SAM-dependent methyltransferase